MDSSVSYTADTTVQSNGNITHSDNSTAETYKINLTITGDLTIDSGGTIDVDSLGYDKDQGPGRGSSSDAGGYGGLGADYTGGPTSITYGSSTAPTNIGSGGDDGVGGGAIQITVTSTSTINGTISADGGNASNAMGAGGSVYLTTGTITGTGTIRAHGGKSSNNGRSGGGGRVAIILTGSGAELLRLYRY